MPTDRSAPPINPLTLNGIGQLLKAEARGLLRTCWRAFWRTTLVVATPLAPYLIFCLFTDEGEKTVGTLLVGIPICMGVALFQAVPVGLVGAALVGMWRLFGGWMFLPVVLAPLVLVGVGWLFSGLVHFQMDNFWQAASEEARRQLDQSSFLNGVRAPGGALFAAILLVLLVPFVLITTLSVLFAPKVLLHLFLLLLLVGGLFLLAMLLTLTLCLPVLGWSLVKRIRARHVFSSARAP